MAYHRQQGVDTCIARIFNTYGPRMRPNDGRAVPTFVRQALQDKPMTVFGDGTQTRSFCSCERSDRRALPPGGRAASTSRSTSATRPSSPWRELAETVIRLTELSRARSSTRPCRSTTPRCAAPNIARARERLGWEPRVTLEEGLTDLIAFERTNKSHSLTGLRPETPKADGLRRETPKADGVRR